MKVEATEVSRVLQDWLGHQRWYAGKSRTGTVQARLLATLADQPQLVQIWLADVSYPEGVEHYQVPLVMRTESVEQLSHALVGSAPDADGGPPLVLYDALHDKEVTGLWLRAMAEQATVDGVSFARVVESDEIPLRATSLALSAEQSNTSLVFDDTAILKVFRRLEAGLNPDIEVHDALGRLGGRHIAKLMGYVSAHVSAEVDGGSGSEVDSAPEVWSLAMLQEFMTTASDGWQLATASVRDLMAEADLHADEAGGDFAAEAHRLGVSTAEVHADLAEAFGTTVLGQAELAERAAAMNARLTAALSEVPELAEVGDGLRQAYAEFAELPGQVLAQRIHGDLHLGQVLRTAYRWVILDFEGEPAKSIGDRQAHDSPIRDVAGMLRSFDYAARHQLIDMGSTPQSEFRAVEWAERNRTAFCAGYAQAGGQDPTQAAVLLRAFEADKAVYESVYEARNRPNWLPIPLASLHRLAGNA